MDEERLRTPVANTHCTACGAPFRCGNRAGETRCWCAALPRLVPLPGESGADCLCAACLRAELERRTAAAPADPD